MEQREDQYGHEPGSHALSHPRMDAWIEMASPLNVTEPLSGRWNLRVPFFFVGFLSVLIIQFPGELVELIDDGHLGVEDLVEAVSHEIGILVGSVTSVDEILEGVDD